MLCLAAALVAIAGVAFTQAFGTPKSVVPMNRGITGIPSAPEGRVVQYVVNCGDLPGKCPAILSMTPIYTSVSELGFELTNPESRQQFEAAVQAQTAILAEMRRSGQLPALDRAALEKYADAVLSGGLAQGEAEADQLLASFLDARSALPETSLTAESGGLTLPGDGYTTDATKRKKPGGVCTFGSPCTGGNCGTIIDGKTSFARCIAACVNCYRI